jgi:hypothetical protein
MPNENVEKVASISGTAASPATASNGVEPPSVNPDTGAVSGTGTQGDPGSTDTVSFSEEVMDELKADENAGDAGAVSTGDLKADEKPGTEEDKKSDEAKKPEEIEEERKAMEERLKEVEKKIVEENKKLEAALRSGDAKKVQECMKNLDSLEKEKETLTSELAKLPPAPETTPTKTPAQTQTPVQSPSASPACAPTAAPSCSPSATPAATQGGPVTANTSNPTAPINLTGNDKKTASFINDYLASKGSPAAGKGAGEMMVKYGKQYNVDPLILLSIAGHETAFGKTGIGVNGMLGVGAYDSDPNNATRNPEFSGIENQIRRGAETFSRLRAKGGSSSDDSIANQLAAANRGGWATDGNWHNGVARMYSQVSEAARTYA